MESILMIFSKQIRNLPIAQIIPFSKDDLLLILTKEVAFKISSISDDKKNVFSISSIMENNKIFGQQEFEKRCLDFINILDTRLERFFDTEKTDYLFFDQEEQEEILRTFTRNDLKAAITIYMRDNEEGQFVEKDFESLEYKEYKKVEPFFRKVGVKCIVRPEKWYIMKSKFSQETKEKIEKIRANKEDAIVKKLLKRYKVLNTINSKEDFKKYYRQLVIKYHPDKGGDAEKFHIIQTDFKLLEGTMWYENIGVAKKPKGGNIFSKFFN